MPLISENQKGSGLVEEFFLGLTENIVGFIKDLINMYGGIAENVLTATYTEINPSPAIVSIGVALTSLFFCLEMFSQLAQFRVERIEDAIRIGMKFVVAKVIIENTDGVSQGIYQLFSISSTGGIKKACGSIGNMIQTIVIDKGAGGLLGIGYLLLFLMIAGMSIFIIIEIFKILISIVGVFFEIAIHQAVAPIALSTLCNELARPTGIAFIKSYASACLQITIMTTICSVFASITGHLATVDFSTIGSLPGMGIFSSVVNFISPLICVIALSKAIKISSDLTKRMFGA